MRASPLPRLVAGLLIGGLLVYGAAVLTESYWITAGVAAIWFFVLGVLVRARPAEPPVLPVSYAPLSSEPNFLIVLRGYHVGQVRALLSRIEATRASGDPALRASVAAEARGAAFLIVLRGYDRGAVDTHLRAAAASLSA